MSSVSDSYTLASEAHHDQDPEEPSHSVTHHSSSQSDPKAAADGGALYSHSDSRRATSSSDSSAELTKKRLNGRQRLMATLVCFGVFLAVIVLAAPGVTPRLLDFMEYLRNEKVAGPLIFIAIFALSVVLLIPSVLFGVGAGFVFPYEVAIPVVYFGSLLGCLMNFAIGRYFCVNMVEIMCLSRSGSLREINNMLGNASSWRLITLLRLPYMGMPHVSYMLSASKASFRHYAVGSALGILPVWEAMWMWTDEHAQGSPQLPECVLRGSVMFAVVGRSIGDLTSSTSGPTLVLTVCLLVGAVVTLVGVVFYAKRAIRKNARAALAEGEVVYDDIIKSQTSSVELQEVSSNIRPQPNSAELQVHV